MAELLINKKNMIKIDLEKTYSVLDLVKLKVIPGIKDYRAYMKRVLEDAALGRKSILKPIILGEGKSRRVYIKGKNLEAYLKTLTN